MALDDAMTIAVNAVLAIGYVVVAVIVYDWITSTTMRSPRWSERLAAVLWPVTLLVAWPLLLLARAVYWRWRQRQVPRATARMRGDRHDDR